MVKKEDKKLFLFSGQSQVGKILKDYKSRPKYKEKFYFLFDGSASKQLSKVILGSKFIIQLPELKVSPQRTRSGDKCLKTGSQFKKEKTTPMKCRIYFHVVFCRPMSFDFSE